MKLDKDVIRALNHTHTHNGCICDILEVNIKIDWIEVKYTLDGKTACYTKIFGRG